MMRQILYYSEGNVANPIMYYQAKEKWNCVENKAFDYFFVKASPTKDHKVKSYVYIL